MNSPDDDRVEAPSDDPVLSYAETVFRDLCEAWEADHGRIRPEIIELLAKEARIIAGNGPMEEEE